MKKAIAIEEQAYEADHPKLAAHYSNLATVEQDLGNLGEAHSLMQKAIAINEKAYDADHPKLADSRRRRAHAASCQQWTVKVIMITLPFGCHAEAQAQEVVVRQQCPKREPRGRYVIRGRHLSDGMHGASGGGHRSRPSVDSERVEGAEFERRNGLDIQHLGISRCFGYFGCCVYCV